MGSFLLYRLNNIVSQHLIREIQLLKHEVALLKELNSDDDTTLTPAPIQTPAPMSVGDLHKDIINLQNRLTAIEEKLGIGVDDDETRF